MQTIYVKLSLGEVLTATQWMLSIEVGRCGSTDQLPGWNGSFSSYYNFGVPGGARLLHTGIH